jgi:putative membrane protein
MTTVALVFAGLAALLHVYIWVMESLTWRQPATWKRFGVASQEEAETQALFAFNQGFYNLFLAITALFGIFQVVVGYADVGWALVLAPCAMMLGAAAVLASCGKQYLRAAITQGLFPLLAVATGILSLT